MRFRKKRKTINRRTKLKKDTWEWMAKYIKLKEAIEDNLDPTFTLVRCKTCGAILTRGTQNCQAGHFISRGSGGQSGVYFEEINVHVQCSQDNAFNQGSPKEYEKYMLQRYGQEVIDRLRLKHKIGSYSDEAIIALGVYYKQQYELLCQKHGITA